MLGVAMIGSAGQYARTMKMSMDWKQKKETGNYTRKSDEKTSELDFYRERLEEIREDATDDRSTIYVKLQTGKKLTEKELDYLKEHDPEAYKKAKEIEAEQKQYEEEIRRCKTREEVDRVRMTYLSSKMAVAKEVSANPNIPKGQKMAILMQENAKMKAVMEADMKFRQTSQYANLPTEEEAAQEAEEKMAELRGEPQREEAAKRAKEEEAAEAACGTGEEAAEAVQTAGQAVRAAGLLSGKGAKQPSEGAAGDVRRTEPDRTEEIHKARREYGRGMYRKEMEVNRKMEFGEMETISKKRTRH